MEHSKNKLPALTRPVLAACLEEAGFSLEDRPLDQLYAYLDLLVRWNRKMNLVGPSRWREILDKLILDSLHLARLLDGLPWPEDSQTWDLGAGAGIPGLPLRMLWDKGEYHLVEAREKRALFLHAALVVLSLPGVRLSRLRAEEFMAQARPAHLILSRAFLPWDKFLALVAGRTASAGLALIMARSPAPELPPELAARWRLHSQRPYLEDSSWFWLFQAKD
ncbi:MAG: 16S rRNA (guanine(527)-N(7))-methyltransferase RsmG [Desulfovibrionaceae bacterium]|nr:16S rRNA (guanine(527)-N(7))-methyltransferase RsmG [Desulfovibrionaceae bacterium]